MRFAYGINAAQGNDSTPSVQYWRGRKGEIDYIFEIGDTPVPIGLAYRSRARDDSLAAVQQFKQEYAAPVGFLLTGDTVQDTEPIRELTNGIIQIPYWLYLLLC
jgi:predicted AAA+ superfamily ATPase